MPASATRLRSGVRSWSGRVAEAWSRELVEAMRTEAPIGTATPTSTRPPGELRKSIRAGRFTPTPTGFRFQVQAPVIQAATTDKGARPHIIRARRAKVLRFWWESGPSGPGIYRYRFVRHPGNAPQDWWQPGLRRQAPSTLRRAARRTPF